MPTQPSVLSAMVTTRRIQEYEVSIDGVSGGTTAGFLWRCRAGRPWMRRAVTSDKAGFLCCGTSKTRSPCGPTHRSEPAMTYLLPPLNALRAFEAAARHLSFKQAAHELHVTAGAIS